MHSMCDEQNKLTGYKCAMFLNYKKQINKYALQKFNLLVI